MHNTISLIKQHFLKLGNVSVKLWMPNTFEILDSVILISMDEPDILNYADPEAPDYCPAWFNIESNEADGIFDKYLRATNGDFERIKFRNVPTLESLRYDPHLNE